MSGWLPVRGYIASVREQVNHTKKKKNTERGNLCGIEMSEKYLKQVASRIIPAVSLDKFGHL